MPLIELKTRIKAPPHRVFDLARSIDAHAASMESSHERAVDGRTTGLIGIGEMVTWEARHLGVTQRLTVQITAFERPYFFCDELVQGAFASMKHTHRFTPEGEGTLMHDAFHFTAPLGILGRLAEGLFLTQYMKTLLLQRNLVLKALAQSDNWRRYLPAEGR